MLFISKDSKQAEILKEVLNYQLRNVFIFDNKLLIQFSDASYSKLRELQITLEQNLQNTITIDCFYFSCLVLNELNNGNDIYIDECNDDSCAYKINNIPISSRLADITSINTSCLNTDNESFILFNNEQLNKLNKSIQVTSGNWGFSDKLHNIVEILIINDCVYEYAPSFGLHYYKKLDANVDSAVVEKRWGHTDFSVAISKEALSIFKDCDNIKLELVNTEEDSEYEIMLESNGLKLVLNAYFPKRKLAKDLLKVANDYTEENEIELKISDNLKNKINTINNILNNFESLEDPICYFSNNKLNISDCDIFSFEENETNFLNYRFNLSSFKWLINNEKSLKFNIVNQENDFKYIVFKAPDESYYICLTY